MSEASENRSARTGTAPEVEVLSSHDDQARRSWWSRPAGVAAILVLALVAAAGVALVRELTEDPSWPSSCGVAGHADWCAEPSEAMTDPGLASLARAHCPPVAELGLSDVVPQPLALIGPPDAETRARTSGTATDGTEEALLGQPGRLAWVTRQVGGPDDGQVRVICPDSTQTTAGLQLEADQLRSTLAAVTTDQSLIDFTAVSRAAVGIPGARDPEQISFGFFTCDTGGIDLIRLRPGRRFSCAVEIYAPEGKGSYRTDFRVTDRPPYFVRE